MCIFSRGIFILFVIMGGFEKPLKTALPALPGHLEADHRVRRRSIQVVEVRNGLAHEAFQVHQAHFRAISA